MSTDPRELIRELVEALRVSDRWVGWDYRARHNADLLRRAEAWLAEGNTTPLPCGHPLTTYIEIGGPGEWQCAACLKQDHARLAAELAEARARADELVEEAREARAQRDEVRDELDRLEHLLRNSEGAAATLLDWLRTAEQERDAAQAALDQAQRERDEAREGPQSVNFCLGCRYYRSTPYQVQGDSGYDRRCLAVDRDLPDNYGDQRTPSWCPYLAAGPTPPLAVVAACDCRAAVEGLLHTIRHEDRQPSESYCAALSDVIDMLTTGAMPFTCPHCGFVHYDERQRIVCNNCGEPPNKGGCDDGQ